MDTLRTKIRKFKVFKYVLNFKDNTFENAKDTDDNNDVAEWDGKSLLQNEQQVCLSRPESKRIIMGKTLPVSINKMHFNI